MFLSRKQRYLLVEEFTVSSPARTFSHSNLDIGVVTPRAEILHRVITLISSGLELEPLLSKMLDSAVTLIRATHGTIGLVIKRNDEPAIRTVAVHNMPPGEMGAEMGLGKGLAGMVLKEGRTIQLGRYGDLDHPTLPELGEHSVIGVPIRWGEEMIGFFGIGIDPPLFFSKEDVESLEVFAQYAAIAIHNADLFNESQRGLDQMRLLYETSHRISLAGDADEVIAAYFDQIARFGRYVCNVCLYDFDAQGDRIAVVVHGRWSAEDGSQRLDERMPYARDDLDPLLDAGETVAITDVRFDPRVPPSLRESQVTSGRLALAMIPLMARNHRIGLVVLSSPGAHEWSEASLWPYQATAAQLAAILDNRLQQELLYERNRQLAILQERQRLARELHDSVTQLIFGIMLIGQSIAPAWRRDPPEGEHRVARLLELSQTALRELRTLLYDLRPLAETASGENPPALTGMERVHRFGLPEALRMLANDYSQLGLRVTVDTREAESNFASARTAGIFSQHAAIEESLYRVTQEALSNAIKHARAETVSIRLAWDGRAGVRLSVRDNGIGLSSRSEEAAEKSRGGLGLHTMRERVEALGGTLQILSTPGKGTAIEAGIPLSKEANP
jgi:signal transduction histidine kinase